MFRGEGGFEEGGLVECRIKSEEFVVELSWLSGYKRAKSQGKSKKWDW